MHRALAFVVGLALAAACTPIRPVPLSNAPENTCPCDAFTGSRCSTSTNRCELGRPSYPFFLIAHVPDSSLTAPSSTFGLYSGDKGAPAFTRTTPPGGSSKCTGSRCTELSGMTLVANLYRVSHTQSARVGFPLKDGQLIPVRVEYEPIANTAIAAAVQPDFAKGLPFSRTFVAPRLGIEGAQTTTTLPSGFYQRVMYPEPPFDALFPPRARPVIGPLLSDNQPTATERLSLPAPEKGVPKSLLDEFLLSDDTIDPIDTRGVTVARDDGLDDWQVWVRDRFSGRRISTLKTLKGTSATLTLDTTGERRGANLGLGDDVEVVLAPPPTWVGVPTFVNSVNGGDLGTIKYPFVYPPSVVEGRVVEPSVDPEQLLGFAASLTFESREITTPLESNPSSPLLRYSTSVSTDDRGRFATVLPPGTYDVTIEPAIGTGFAKVRQIVLVNSGHTGLTLRPPKRTLVRGRIVLADQRPVAEAEILATPRTPTNRGDPKPRPNQTTTNLDGRFALELDQGPYAITAVPKAGTGFPQVATLVSIIADDTDLAEITIPAPTVLSFQLRDASIFESVVANAILRVFTLPAQPAEGANASSEAIEIGLGMTDADGNVEILLAPSPP